MRRVQILWLWAALVAIFCPSTNGQDRSAERKLLQFRPTPTEQFGRLTATLPQTEFVSGQDYEVQLGIENSEPKEMVIEEVVNFGEWAHIKAYPKAIPSNDVGQIILELDAKRMPIKRTGTIALKMMTKEGKHLAITLPYVLLQHLSFAERQRHIEVAEDENGTEVELPFVCTYPFDPRKIEVQLEGSLQRFRNAALVEADPNRSDFGRVKILFHFQQLPVRGLSGQVSIVEPKSGRDSTMSLTVNPLPMVNIYPNVLRFHESGDDFKANAVITIRSRSEKSLTPTITSRISDAPLETSVRHVGRELNRVTVSIPRLHVNALIGNFIIFDVRTAESADLVTAAVIFETQQVSK